MGIAGLTAEQAAAVEAATLLANDPVRHDGLILAIAAALGAGPTYTNAEVTAAMASVLRDYSGRSIPTDILFPAA
jgi:hypothetical protein